MATGEEKRAKDGAWCANGSGIGGDRRMEIKTTESSQHTDVGWARPPRKGRQIEKRSIPKSQEPQNPENRQRDSKDRNV